eukprot:TRINITY_DN30988_c0_g1_i1.p1 TRINITY_DN30988_c0_g1~~TRINITY_DN30988_c0_g1_i1.p1  ORF type:complete len:1498 (+),score=350.54 TRINITY_DN30988_c0_g1_i1:53-4546(+)
MEYKLFKPRKPATDDDASWQSYVKERAVALDDLIKAGEKGRDDLELFLEEVVWATLRGDLTAVKAAEFLSETQLSSKDSLQKLLGDVLWLVGFSATEAPSSREVREEFTSLCSQLENKAVLSKTILATSLETESAPLSLVQIQNLRKKQNQAKTKARYTITRFNLLREHSEGYARLLYLLDRLASMEFQPEATPEQIAESRDVLIEDVIRLIGFSNLCPNRIIAMTMDIYERRLAEAEPCPLAEPLVELLRRLPKKRLTKVVVFQLLAHGPAPLPSGKPLPSPTPPSRPTQFLAVASLISLGLVDLDVIWSYLDPADASIKQSASDLTSKYEEEVSNVTKIDLAGSSTKDSDAFNRAYQAFNRVAHQKFRLTAALISVNDWRSAQRCLLHLQTLCKPSLNHHIRSALCDLLKWVIQPLLRPMQQRLPNQSKPSLESTFACTRRFSLGLQRPTGEAGACLRQVTDVGEVLPQLKQVLEHLEYFFYTDAHLMASLWKVVGLAVKKPENGTNGSGSPATLGTLDDGMVAVVYRHLLPAASLVPHNAHLSDLMWSLMQQLTVFQRFMIYSCWETMYSSFLLKLVFEKTKVATKQILKRVVANAERRDLIAHQSNFHICKLCHSNPIPVIEVMMRDVEIGFNVNMIQPYVETTNRCTEMTADVMGYVLARMCARPVTETRVFLDQADATLSPWLTNLAEFVGRFYKKHSTTDLVGLLSVITKRINSDAPEVSTSGLPPKEYKGESLIRVVLENLLEFMGGFVSVKDMTSDQLICLAGGPRLKTESVSYGKREDQTRKEKARKLLFDAIVDLGLVTVLWHSLSQQRLHFLSEEFSEAHSGGGGLKLLGLLFDGNHDCFLKLTEFLAQACTRDKYMSLLPPFQEIFSMFELSMAFLVVRHGLPSYGRGMTSVVPKATAAGEKPKPQLVATAEEVETQKKLETVVRLYQPTPLEDEGLSMQFYVTFWRLSLQDIYMPIEGYDRALAQINASQKQVEASRFKMERNDRDYAHSRDYKNLKKEGARLKDFHDKLKEELLGQRLNHEKVLQRLEQQKSTWFPKPSPQATSAFVSEMIAPRVLTSHADALFCCRFVRLLIKLKTPGFQLLDFYNCWTTCLTQNIRCCSEREAQIFGVFLREMMAYIFQLRKNEKDYEKEVKDNPVFHRNYYEEPLNSAVVEYAKYADILKGHAKWEGRIYKALRQNLDSEDWMEKRNALLLLSQSCESFPVVEKYGKQLLQCVENMRDKEEFSDVKTLATSLAVKLRSCSDNWVDKKAGGEAADAAPAKDESKGGRHTEEVRKVSLGVKNPLATVNTTAQSKAAAQPASQKSNPSPDGKRSSHGDSNGGSGDKRPREEGKTSSTVVEIKEAKHHKESKESKEKEKDKESRRTADRGREKDRDRAKSSEKEKSNSLKDADWKRSAGSGSVPATSSIDERPEKRRRSERDSEVVVTSHSSRSGTSDRNSARNALSAADSGGSSRTVSSHDHSRSRAHSGGSNTRHDGHRRR